MEIKRKHLRAVRAAPYISVNPPLLNALILGFSRYSQSLHFRVKCLARVPSQRRLQYLSISCRLCPAGQSQTHPPRGISDGLLLAQASKTVLQTNVKEEALTPQRTVDSSKSPPKRVPK